MNGVALPPQDQVIRKSVTLRELVQITEVKLSMAAALLALAAGAASRLSPTLQLQGIWALVSVFFLGVCVTFYAAATINHHRLIKKRSAGAAVLLFFLPAQAIHWAGVVAILAVVAVIFVVVIVPLAEMLGRNDPPPPNPQPVQEWVRPPATNAPPAVPEPPVQPEAPDNPDLSETDVYDRYEPGKGVVERHITLPSWMRTKRK